MTTNGANANKIAGMIEKEMEFSQRINVIEHEKPYMQIYLEMAHN